MDIQTRVVSILRDKYKAQIEQHKLNIYIYLSNSVGVAEHPDVIESIENQIDAISALEDRLSVLEKHF
jgi:hypothetical protein